MQECLAVIERGDFRSSTAATAGAAAGCPFCRSRGAPIPTPGEQILFLQGSRAGLLVHVSDCPNTVDYGGFLVEGEDSLRHTLSRVALERDLFATLPLSPLPGWVPPLDLRDAFVIDELAVWFCNRGLASERFHWKRDDILVVVQAIWQRRIPLEPGELSAAMLAHGLPPDRQEELEDYYEFGIKAAVAVAGRRAVRKRRLPMAMHNRWTDTMRRWGR
jgi:hypothetical protein